MPYGTIKVDNVIYTKGGVDTTITVSGIVDSLSGAISVTGSISGASVSATTGTFTTLSGNTTAGTTATFTSGIFTTFSGTTVNVVSGVFASGTFALPSVSVGTSGNGLYSPGTNQVGISTSGNGRLTVDSAGNVSVDGSTVYIDAANNRVGLGTASPTSLLHLVTSSSSGSSNADGVRINSGGNVAINIGSNSTTGYGWIQSANWGAGYISTVINPNGGNVGIGTTSPSSLLEVAGITTINASGASANSQLNFKSGGAGVSGFQIGQGLNSQFLFVHDAAAATERIRLDSSGRLGIGTASPGCKIDILAENNTSLDPVLRINSNNVAVNTAIAYDGISGSSQFQLRTSSANPLLFGTNNTERARIDSSGRLLIGQTSTGLQAARSMAWQGFGEGALYMSHSTSDGNGDAFINFGYNANLIGKLIQEGTTGIGLYSNNELTFGTTGFERARIDSSGRLLVGTSTSRTSAFGQGLHQIEGGSVNAFSSVTNAENSQFGGAFILAKTRGSAFQAVTNNDNLGILSFQGANGSALLEAARIEAATDGAVTGGGANDMPGRLVFSTTADGEATPTEALRIINSGRHEIGSSQQGIICGVTSAAGTATAAFVAKHSITRTSVTTTGTDALIIWSNGNVVNLNGSYGAISDIKLKENIVDATSQWSDIKALQVRKYNFKEGQTHTQIGLIAQEVELVSPGLVSESPDRDAENNDLGTVTKSVNYSVLYMKAVKALQEAMERIETLEAKVAALESR